METTLEIPVEIRRAVSVAGAGGLTAELSATKFAIDGYGVHGLLASLGLGHFTDIGAIGPLTTAFAGTSTGSLVAAMLAIGFTGPEVCKYFTTFNFVRLMKDPAYKPCCCCREPRIVRPYSSRQLEDIIVEVLKAKGFTAETTFGELRTHRGKTLIVSALCVDRTADGQPLMHFSPKTAPNVPISLAVRAAMSTQGVYPPVWISGNYYADSRLLYNYPIEIFEIPAVVDPIAGTAMGMRAVRNIFSNDATTSTIVSIDYDEHKKPSAVPTASKLSSAAVSLLQDLQGPQILSDVERRYTVNVSFPTINPFDFEETNRLLPAARAACVDAIKLFCGSQSGYGGYPAGTVTASRR